MEEDLQKLSPSIFLNSVNVTSHILAEWWHSRTHLIFQIMAAANSVHNPDHNLSDLCPIFFINYLLRGSKVQKLEAWKIIFKIYSDFYSAMLWCFWFFIHILLNSFSTFFFFPHSVSSLDSVNQHEIYFLLAKTKVAPNLLYQWNSIPSPYRKTIALFPIGC